MTTQTKTTPKAAATNAKAVKLPKAEVRKSALAKWADNEEKVKPLLDKRGALKSEAIALCEDGKTYKDSKGRQISVNMFSESNGYKAVLDMILAGESPADEKMIKWVEKTIASKKSVKKSSTPLKVIA